MSLAERQHLRPALRSISSHDIKCLTPARYCTRHEPRPNEAFNFAEIRDINGLPALVCDCVPMGPGPSSVEGDLRVKSVPIDFAVPQ